MGRRMTETAYYKRLEELKAQWYTSYSDWLNDYYQQWYIVTTDAIYLEEWQYDTVKVEYSSV